MEISTIKAEVRAFVESHPTPQTRRMLALCECGTISWADAHELSRKALAASLAAVSQ